MSQDHNRTKDRTVAFHVSQEDFEQLDFAVSLSGMLKQDYIISKLLDRSITAVGNCKMHKTLYDKSCELLEELKRIEAGAGIDERLMSNIELLTGVINGIYQKN